MTTRNEARSNTQREANTREEEFVFEEPDEALQIGRFRNISVKDKDDISNVGKKQQQGWVFVTPDEVPELAITSFVKEDGRYTGTVCRGDLALAKIPSNRVTARRKYYEDKSNTMMDAVNAQLMKNNDSRMPISNTSKSVRTTGRQPSFQD